MYGERAEGANPQIAGTDLSVIVNLAAFGIAGVLLYTWWASTEPGKKALEAVSTAAATASQQAVASAVDAAGQAAANTAAAVGESTVGAISRPAPSTGDWGPDMAAPDTWERTLHTAPGGSYVEGQQDLRYDGAPQGYWWNRFSGAVYRGYPIHGNPVYLGATPLWVTDAVALAWQDYLSLPATVPIPDTY